MIKFSLILPVYNVEKYLSKCILSCLQQNLLEDDYEIIIINDGSIDKSLEVAESFQSKHSNIFIISQTNSGLSAARNTGLQKAKGEYIWFIDSDDWIMNNCLSKLYDEMSINDLDILWFDHVYIDEDGVCLNKRKSNKIKSSEVMNGDCFINDIFSFQTYAWCFVFKRLFLIENNLFFKEGVFYEDIEFTPRVIYRASRVRYLSERFYYYLKRSGSILNSYNDKKIYDLVTVLGSTAALIEELSNSYNIYYLKQLYSINFVGLLWNASDSRFKSKRYKLFKYSCFKHEYLICDFSSIGLFFNIIILLYKISPAFTLYFLCKYRNVR